MKRRQAGVHTQPSSTTSSGETGMAGGGEQVDQHADRTQVMLHWGRDTKADSLSLLCSSVPPPHIKGNRCSAAPENFKEDVQGADWWAGAREAAFINQNMNQTAERTKPIEKFIKNNLKLRKRGKTKTAKNTGSQRAPTHSIDQWPFPLSASSNWSHLLRFL